MRTHNMTSRRGVLKLLSSTVIVSGLMATAGRAQNASVATAGDSAIAIDFDLGALTSSPFALAMVPLFLVLLLIIRGLPSLLAAPPGSSPRDKGALMLFGATALPIIVAVTTIGREHGLITTGISSALIGAGMLSVLLFPLLALRRLRRPEALTAGLRPPKA